MGVSQNWEDTLFAVPITELQYFGIYIGVPPFWETPILSDNQHEWALNRTGASRYCG